MMPRQMRAAPIWQSVRRDSGLSIRTTLAEPQYHVAVELQRDLEESGLESSQLTAWLRITWYHEWEGCEPEARNVTIPIAGGPLGMSELIAQLQSALDAANATGGL